MIRKGRITKIERENMNSCYVTQGITRDRQSHYDNSSKYVGGNGTYYHDFQSEPHINLYLTIYENGEYSEERVVMDIRDSILSKNNLQRVSAKKLKEIQDANVGKKVSFEWNPVGNISFGDQLSI